MNIGKIIGNFFNGAGGGIIKEGFDVVKAYFPPDMSEEQKMAAQLAYDQFAHKKEIEILQKANEADKEFNQRIKDLEGTANDLKQLPVVGRIVIFIRGAQRPVWGLFTLFADYQVFNGAWKLTDIQEQMVFAINILVLGFLFGERAVKNIMPFVMNFFGVRKGIDK